MTLKGKICNLLDFDFGYDNESLAGKIEKTTDEFAIGFAEWLFDVSRKGSTKELLEIYKKENNL